MIIFLIFREAYQTVLVSIESNLKEAKGALVGKFTHS